MKTRFTLSDDWPMVAAVASANSSVSHCDDNFLTCDYAGGTVIWREPTEPDTFRVEVGGRSGAIMTFNHIVFMFTGKGI
ncbi:hypothetical protein CN359_30550 [Bacillus thuringiensis]|nr:hypothetical protein CN359_30550 [Bacillus thuringiensis]